MAGGSRAEHRPVGAADALENRVASTTQIRCASHTPAPLERWNVGLFFECVVFVV
jgi:hypothetical protein